MGCLLIAIVLWVGFVCTGARLYRIAEAIEKKED